MARRTPRRNARPETAAPALLWAPWRSAYVGKPQEGSGVCIFCFGRIGAESRRRRLVLYAGRLALVMLNRYPYSNGHPMVAPRRHVGSLELLTRDERGDLWELMRERYNGCAKRIGRPVSTSA